MVLATANRLLPEAALDARKLGVGGSFQLKFRCPSCPLNRGREGGGGGMNDVWPAALDRGVVRDSKRGLISRDGGCSGRD